MDTFSQASLDSEDSIPRNVYEEVVVDSTIQSADSKEDENDENVEEAVLSKPVDPVSESEDDTDDEEVESSTSSSTIAAPSTAEVNISATQPSDKPTSISTEEHKTSNLKLVLKKSPEYQLVNPSSTQGKSASCNKIFLVTLVSNTNTSPVYETAKYPVAATDDTKASAVSVVSSKITETNESVDEPENCDDTKLEVLKPASDSNTVIKTYSKTSLQTVAAEELEADLGDNSSEPTKDEVEIGRLETDSKPSTPKIGRELQQLKKTLNESKILSEFMSESMGKSRKARKTIPLKGSDNEGSSPLPVRSRSRSCSKPRMDSPTDNGEKLRRWPSEEKLSKRQNMRSQNSEFVQKQMKFLNSIQGEDPSDNSDGETSITDGKSSSHSINDSQQNIVMKREIHPSPQPGWDMFCFKCHFGAELMPCSKCIRSFHAKCVKNASPSKAPAAWLCPECVAIENQIKSPSRVKSNFWSDNMNQLLQFALNRMKQSKGSEYFLTDFNEEDYPDIRKYLVHPVTLEMLQSNIEKKTYKCTEEFAVDSKWILHNCSVYFGNNSKVTNFAKGIVKVCRQEVTEIDTCPECYYNANTRKDWFVEVCSRPHMLLWAKLKGFPYWPAKSMGVNGALVNVRFFGDHDRAYVPIKECFLYSENDPNPPTKQNKKSIKECIKEVDIHIRKITAKFGTFVYPAFRTMYEPTKELQQLELMIPGITESLKNAEKGSKPALTYKIVKTADNHLSIIKKDEEKIDDVINTNTIPVNTVNEAMQIAEAEKSQKQRVQSTDSSHSNNEVTSTCETTVETVSNHEAPKETKTVEKTVAPMKIQERISTESATKTYEVVSKVIDQEQTKVNSVILKRKSDNWNAVTASTNKKSKVIPDSNESITKEIESNTSTTENISSPTLTSTPTNQPIITTIKRKRSREDVATKAQKLKLDGDKIPPLAPLTPPYVIAPANSSVTTQAPVAPPVSSLPVITSLNSSVTVTITQSPVVTSVSTNESTSTKSSPMTISSVLSLENSEISIKRIQKKHIQQPQAISTTQSNSSTSNEKAVVEVVATVSTAKEKEPTAKKTPTLKTSVDQPTVVASPEKTLAGSGPKKICELIPFEEIKTEKPDSEDQNPELIEVRSKTTTPEHPSSTSRSLTNVNSGEVTFRPVVIKTEIMSDDDLSNASRSEENGECENSSPSNNKGSDIKATAKILPQSHISNQKGGNIQVKTAGKPESSKKQRARKSFPNKTNFNPLALTATSNSMGVKRPAVPQSLLPQNNGMVYIPVDQAMSTGSIPNLTSTAITTPSSSAAPKSIVNVSAPASNSITSNAVSMHAISGLNAISSSITPLSSTILTTSLQLPIVYSAIPMPSVNGPPNSQSNPTTMQVTCSVPPNIPITSEQHMLSGFVTPTLASAITDAIVKGPPRLAPRPSGPLRSEGDYIFPTEAGPVSRMLIENAHKMTDFFRSVIEDTLSDMSKNHNLEAKVRMMELELEKSKYTHEKEIAELKHNTDLMLCEMRKSLENEKTRLVAETRKQCELERVRAVEEAKTKQWCAACGKEAQFYCCWNTSYCDYPCQQKHWSRHMSSCAQKDNADANAQRVGVKISPYNVKDKQNKAKESAVPKQMPNNASVRAVYPAPLRNSVPAIKRLIPITTQTTPRYTLINSNEGSWGLVPSPQFPRVFPTSGLVMSDGSNKALSPSAVNLLRTPKM